MTAAAARDVPPRPDPPSRDGLVVAHERLTAAVAELAGSEGWRRLLTVAARFHHYSPSNVLLICAQRPDATAVAGFRTWTQLGRQVRRGERGIAILAPVRARASQATDADARPASASPAGPAAGTGPGVDRRSIIDRPATAAAPPTGAAQANRRAVRGFRVVHVFDVSQTDGPDLPQPPAPELLAGAAPDGLWNALAEQVREQGFGLVRADCGRANGIADFFAKTVVIAPQLPEAMACKTLAHEIGHLLLHRPEVRPAGLDRPRAEVEAESVAYIVTQAHGLTSGTYTVPYVTGWAGGDTELLRGTADRVLAAAAQILRAAPPPAASALASDAVHRPLARIQLADRARPPVGPVVRTDRANLPPGDQVDLAERARTNRVTGRQRRLW